MAALAALSQKGWESAASAATGGPNPAIAALGALFQTGCRSFTGCSTCIAKCCNSAAKNSLETQNKKCCKNAPSAAKTTQFSTAFGPTPLLQRFLKALPKRCKRCERTDSHLWAELQKIRHAEFSEYNPGSCRACSKKFGEFGEFRTSGKKPRSFRKFRLRAGQKRNSQKNPEIAVGTKSQVSLKFRKFAKLRFPIALVEIQISGKMCPKTTPNVPQTRSPPGRPPSWSRPAAGSPRRPPRRRARRRRRGRCKTGARARQPSPQGSRGRWARRSGRLSASGAPRAGSWLSAAPGSCGAVGGVGAPSLPANWNQVAGELHGLFGLLGFFSPFIAFYNLLSPVMAVYALL